MFYRICPKCSHEFYTEEKWNNHPCNAGKTSDDARQKAVDTLSRMGGEEALKSLDPEMAMEILRPMGAEGLEIARRIGIAAKGGDGKAAKSAPTGGEDNIPPAESITARLNAADETLKMKQELVAAGHEVQTLSAEETREEYARLLKEKGVQQDGEPAATTPSTAKTKKKKTQKAGQPEA